MPTEPMWLEIIEQQRAICHELYAVTRDQLASLEAADYDRLQLFLNKRQALLERLIPLDTLPAEDLEAFGEVERRQIERTRQEISRILSEILAMDQSTRCKMESHRAELQLAIREVRQGRQALAGYRHILDISPRLFDQAH